LQTPGFQPLVGSVGDSYDNALAGTVIGLYKTEVIRRLGPWRSLEALELTTLEWIDWFNNRRLRGPLSYSPPAEAEATAASEKPGTCMASQRNCRVSKRDVTKSPFRSAPT
jgi:transposase InsO family protein